MAELITIAAEKPLNSCIFLVKKMTKFAGILERAEAIADIFEIVKEIVYKALQKRRSGLMLGFADLGMSAGNFVGAFYQVGSNAIIVNRAPLSIIEKTKPELLKHYLFYILLHEYLHSLGILDEKAARHYAYLISKKFFGNLHTATMIAQDFSAFFSDIALDIPADKNFRVEIVKDFEKDTPYIG